MRQRRSVSNMRRGFLAVALILLSLVSHAAAAGSLPSITAAGGAAAVAGGIAWSLAGRRRSLSSLIAILFAGQLLIHASVVALGHHGIGYVPDLRMLVAHLIAAGFAAALFVRGEQIVAAWVRAATRILGAGNLSLPLVASKSSHTIHSPHLAFLVELGHEHSVSRRGPPATLGAPAFA